MKIPLTLLVLAASLTATLGQSKLPAKRGTKPAVAIPKSTAVKPSSTTKPAGRPATTTRPTTPPATTTAPATTPAPPANAPVKLEIPGVPDQQAPSFTKGNIAVNLGLGLGIGYGYGLSFAGNASSSPAISLSVEKGVVEGVGPGVISVGGLIGYKSYDYKWAISGDAYKATWRNIYMAARGAYHYNFTADPRIDTYAGISLATRIESYSDNYKDNTLRGSYGGANIDVGVFLGGRYLLTDNIGAFAELGYDMSYLKLGLTTKF